MYTCDTWFYVTFSLLNIPLGMNLIFSSSITLDGPGQILLRFGTHSLHFPGNLFGHLMPHFENNLTSFFLFTQFLGEPLIRSIDLGSGKLLQTNKLAQA